MSLKDVSNWYEDPKNIGAMRHWVQGEMKIWEKKVAGLFPAGSKILDVGCGMGREAFALHRLGFDVTGIDIAQGVIDEVKLSAQQNGFDIPFLCYDGQKLPFPADSFNVVIIWAQTFGLLYGDDYKRRFLSECKRVLRGGGFLSYSGHDDRYLSKHDPQCLNGRKFYAYASTHMYWETFTGQELCRYGAEAGFEVIFCEAGQIYKPEDGTVLHCLCRKNNS